MKKTITLLILSLGTLLAFCPASARAEKNRAPVRIMCLGDSITYGMPDYTTVDAYRTDLSRFLDQAGWSFQLINNGHPGKDSRSIDLNYITGDLASTNPDIVLYMIGTNDITFGFSYELSVLHIKSAINKMVSYGVSKVFLAAVCPRFDFESRTIRQNNLAQYQRQVAADLRSENKNVFLADINGYMLSKVNTGNWRQYYISDGKHPNDAGYYLMAEGWKDALTDTTPPAKITDLQAEGIGSGQIKIFWTAPTDNSFTNRVLRYIIKYSTSEITEANFDSATTATGSPYPSAAGTSENFTLNNLTAGTVYYLAAKSEDNSGNLSLISNGASAAAAQDSNPPSVAKIVIDGVEIRTGDIISARPLIKIFLQDLQTSRFSIKAAKPSTIKIYLDDQLVTDGAASGGHYDSFYPESGIVEYQVKNDLSQGSHSVGIEAEDYNGNVMSLYKISNLQVYSGGLVVLGQVLNYPNPFNPERENTKIAYYLSSAADVQLYIFDYGFKPVYRAAFSSGSSGGSTGYNEILWDGRNQLGQTVTNGIYQGRLVSGSRVLGKVKIAVLK